MEDILSVYRRGYDERHVLICMDEMSKQLIDEVRRPLPMTHQHEARYDYEYKRNGVVNLFMFFDPIRGWRHITVTERRTKQDWAACIAELVEVHCAKAEKITLVMDNLNTHTPASLYERFTPERAKRIVDRLEIHYTPEHGSWLNMAEIELSVLGRQCLGRRLGKKATLVKQVAAWQQRRNGKRAGVSWRFTTADARIKLKRLYPSIDT